MSIRHDVGQRIKVALLALCTFGFVVGLAGCAGYASSPGGSTNPGTAPAPIISAVSSGSPTATGATISWTTNVPSTSLVNYGTTASYGQRTPLISNLVTSHSTGLSGLTPSTLYHFEVVSKDSSGTQTTSVDHTFTTAPSTTPPTISGVTAGGITSSGATITWTTNVGATSEVNYGTTTSYGQSSALKSSLVTSHSVALSGLTASTLYHFQVVSKDGNGNQAASADFSFTTAASSAAPTISSVTASGITSSGATITWTTNVGATSQVNYGITTSYGRISALSSNLVTSHSVALSGLTASTLYHVQVVSKDGNGNQASSGDFTFTTLANSGGGGSICPSGIGWCDNSGAGQVSALCAALGNPGSCSGIYTAWSGGAMDTTNHQMLVFGGGHSDYSGNEVYSYNLASQTVSILVPSSSTIPSLGSCTNPYPDGKPASRHTYGGEVFVPSYGSKGGLWIYGGVPWCVNGGFKNDT